MFKRAFYCFLLVFIGALLGYAFFCLQSNDFLKIKNKPELRLQPGGSGLTNPLLDCDLGEEYISNNAIKPFKSVIDKKILELKANGLINYASYYFRDLNNGGWMGINEEEKFFPASLMKVPILLYALNKAVDDPGLLNKEIKYLGNSTIYNQYIKPENPIKIGEIYTIRQLLEKMIIESDNNAASLIYEIFGKDDYQKIFSSLSLEIPTENESYYIDTKDYASFFRILFNSSYLPNKFSEAALNLLSKTKLKDGIVAGVPSDIVVAHKFGEVTLPDQKQFHDCGIVYYPKSPYLLCIMTRGNHYDNLISSIAELSRVTFGEVQSQKIKN